MIVGPSGPPFTLTTAASFAISPKNTSNVTLQFTPTQKKHTYHDQITIKTDDPQHPPTIEGITGKSK
jgi:hypothetical protein